MTLSTDEREFAKRWLEKGMDRGAITTAIEKRRKETGSFSDTAYGAVSAVPTTVLGAGELLGKASKGFWSLIPGKFAKGRADWVQNKWIDPMKRRSDRIQLNVESKGADAEFGQLPGNMVVDAALTAAATAATAPAGGEGGAIVAAERAPKYARYLETLKSLAQKSPRMAGWLKNMGMNLPMGLTIGAMQDQGQGYDVGKGMVAGTVGMGLFSLIGAKGASRRLLNESDDVGRIGARAEEALAKTGKIDAAERKFLTPEYVNGDSRPALARNVAASKSAQEIGDTKGLGRTMKNWVQSNYHLLDAAGAPGKMLKRQFRNAERETIMTKSKFLPYIHEFQEFGKMNEGKLSRLVAGLDKPKTLEEKKALGKARAFYEEVISDFENKTGKKIPRKENYLNTVVKPEYMRKILDGRINKKELRLLAAANAPVEGGAPIPDKMMANILKDYRAEYAKQDMRAGFERKNEMKIPWEWREKDFHKLATDYLQSVAKRGATIKYLGPQGEVAYGLLAKIAREAHELKNTKSNPAMIERILKQYFHRVPQEKYIENIKGFQMMKMSTSSISQLGDHVQTAMRHGMMNTFLASMQLLGSKSARFAADVAGAAADEGSASRTGITYASRFTKWWMDFIQFTRAQQWTDRTLVLSGLKRAKQLRQAAINRPNSWLARKRIADFVGGDFVDVFIEKGLTPKMKRRIGADAMLSLRPINNMDVPFNFNEPGVKSLVTQFRKFTVQISRTVNQEIREKWLSGDRQGAMNSLAALLVAGTITGEIVKTAKNKAWDSIIGTMNYVIHGEWETPQHQKRAESFFGRISEDMAAAGGIGLATELWGAIGDGNYDNSGRVVRLLGPTASDIEGAISTVVKAITKTPGKISSGKQTGWEAAGKITGDLLRPIPFARKIFNTVVRGVGLKGKNSKPSSTLLGDAFDRIKEEIHGSTDAGATASMVGNEHGISDKAVTVYGDGGKKLAEYINEGNGAWFHVAKVLDGDTIRFEDGSTLRFGGVNAPELRKEWLNNKSEPGAEKAKDFVSDAFPIGSEAYVVNDKASGGVDFAGRKIGYPFTKDGRDISKELIETGNAKIFNKYPYDRKKEFNNLSNIKFTLDKIPNAKKTLRNIAKSAISNEARYKAVEAATGVPWRLVAAINQREGGGSFNKYLHNGQELGKPTTIVPKGISFGKGQWEAAAIDAINRIKRRTGINLKPNASLEEMANFAEYYNGLGYRYNGISSPYVWSGTNKYKKGKYVKDGVYNPKVVDKQLGVVPMIVAIYKLSKS